MTSWQLVLTTISVIVGVGGFITALTVALTNNKRASKAERHQSESEVKDFAAKQTEQTMKLEYIGKDVADIKFSMSRFDEKLDNLSNKTHINTEKLKTAFVRIDEIKEFIGFGKGNNGK